MKRAEDQILRYLGLILNIYFELGAKKETKI